MDLLARILQKSKVLSTKVEVCFISSIMMVDHNGMLVTNRIGAPHQTEQTKLVLRTKYVTLRDRTSPTHTQSSEHGGKSSAKIKQHTQPTSIPLMDYLILDERHES